MANGGLGKRSLTRDEFEIIENSSVIFQEIVALLLGSESVKHIDLRNVLRKPPPPPVQHDGTPASPGKRICEVVPPIVLLWKSLQSRCNSVDLSGNAFGPTDVSGICKSSQLHYLWIGLTDAQLGSCRIALVFSGRYHVPAARSMTTGLNSSVKVCKNRNRVWKYLTYPTMAHGSRHRHYPIPLTGSLSFGS